MADEATPGAQPAPQQPTMKILGQFIRDLSFENILAQKPLEGEVQPDIQVQVGLDAKKRPTDKQFEVATKLNITSKRKGGTETLFVMELDYAGIFLIDGVPDNQMHPFLLIECPRMLFPFVRRIVSDVTRDGGFPPLNLDTIDFVNLYKQQLQNQAKAQQAPTNGAAEQQPS